MEKVIAQMESRNLALKLYDRWVRQRQARPAIDIPPDETGKEGLKKLGLKNFASQLVHPRKQQLGELKKVAKQMSIADKIALLVMMELPVLETSSLLHKLSMQLAANPGATYFSLVNQADNCGCGCG